MNKALRCAWFNLVATLLLALLHGAAFILIFKTGHIPQALNTVGFVIVFVVLSMTVVVFRKKQKLSEVEYDERDRAICSRVLAIDYGLVWAILIGGCVSGWSLMGPDGVVRIYVLCFILYLSFLLAMLVHSATTIILYGGRCGTSEIVESGE